MPQSGVTMRIPVTGSTSLLIIVGLWLWTMSMAFQLQHRHRDSTMNPKSGGKFTRRIGLHSSTSIDDDDDDYDYDYDPMISSGRPPADRGKEFH